MISVIIPAFNAASFIDEAIKSIINQSYKDFELIIINDGSTDHTEKIINSYEDTRIKLFNNDSNMGIVFSLNKALSLSNGKYIARMDVDDVAHQNRLSLQLNYLKTNNLDICGSAISLFGSKEKLIMYPESVADVRFFSIFGSPVAHPTVFGYAHILKKYTYNNVAAEDYDLWLRMLIDGINIGNMPISLLNYRVHDNQLTLDKSEIINSSISISKSYIKSYIDDEEIRRLLVQYECFMKGDFDRKGIYAFAKKICMFAKMNKVSTSIQSRAMSIIFARANSYNLFTLVSYIKVLKIIDSRILVNIDKRLAFLFIFSIKKNSKLVLLLSRILKNI